MTTKRKSTNRLTGVRLPAARLTDAHLTFGAGSAVYAAARPRYPDDLFAWIAAHCREHTRAWDCACGNGQAALGLAQHFAQVCATDLSTGQLAAAIKDPAIAYAVQSAEAPAFAPASFDAICVAQALHWFDLASFWPAVQRVLRPGGVFAAWGYAWFTVTPAVDRVVAAQLLPRLAAYWAPQNRLLWDGYRTIAWPFAPLDPPDFAITVEWTAVQLWDYIGSWSAARRCMEAEGAPALAAARTALLAAWGDSHSPRRVTMPLTVQIGRRDG